MDKKKTAELLSAAEAAAFTADFASNNIKKYLSRHSSDSAVFVMKIAGDQAHYVMKIANETEQEVTRIVRESAELAAKNLQEFVKRHKGQ